MAVEADDVLDDDQDDADAQEHEQPGTSLDEHPGVRGESHRREEHQEEGVLQGEIEAQLDAQKAVDQSQQQRDHAAADDGRRDVQAPEDRHRADQEATEEEHPDGDDQRRDEIEPYRAHGRVPSAGEPAIGSVHCCRPAHRDHAYLPIDRMATRTGPQAVSRMFPMAYGTV